jgi:hypothetical protein
LRNDESQPYLTDDPETNPFVAPTAGLRTSILSPAEEQTRWLRWGWPTAVVLHLPVPLWFGWMVTANGLPKLGMFFGIAIVYWIGRRLCSGSPWLMKRLCIGAMITSVSQFWPIAQMFIGAYAISISGTIFSVDNFGGGPGNMNSLPGVVLATILTGIGLIIPSLAVGMMAMAIFDRGKV